MESTPGRSVALFIAARPNSTFRARQIGIAVHRDSLQKGLAGTEGWFFRQKTNHVFFVCPYCIVTTQSRLLAHRRHTRLCCLTFYFCPGASSGTKYSCPSAYSGNQHTCMTSRGNLFSLIIPKAAWHSLLAHLFSVSCSTLSVKQAKNSERSSHSTFALHGDH